MRRFRQIMIRGDTPVLALSVVTGALVALIVASFEFLANDVLLERISKQPLWQIAIAPAIGLLLATLLLHVFGKGASSATSDEFIRAYHERSPRLPFREMPAKLLAGISTIGFGGALGLEGPSIYAGSATGLAVRNRFRQWLRREDIRILLTAGAAAGMAAVFKAPATGVLFALEAPYRDDVTRRALIPSLLASATSYVTYINLVGPTAVIPFLNNPESRIGLDFLEKPNSAEDNLVWLSQDQLSSLFSGVEVSDIIGAILVGILAGLGGRSMAWLVRWAKGFAKKTGLLKRILFGAPLLAGLAIAANAAFEVPLSTGPGFRAMEWVVAPNHGLGLIALLFGFRIAATIVTLGAGGVGGLFIPLAVQGVILGQFVSQVVGSDRPGLYPILGLAAFLGAGYRAPISAVMFVAESTGGFVVPALIAAAMSQLVAGPASVADHQKNVRLGHLERRFTLPVTSALTTDILTIPPDATLSEFVYIHVLGRRERSVAVVEGGTYLGMLSLSDLSQVDRTDWEKTSVSNVLKTNLPTAKPSWTLRDAIGTMGESESDVLPVTDADGNFIGLIREEDILKLDEILEETAS